MESSTASYKIRFLTGELAGRVFAVRNSGTMIGRRRDADIRPGGMDIAAEHVTLIPQTDHGVLLHVHENESAWVNGEEKNSNEDVMLSPGADVRIGKELTFVLEEDDALPGMDSAPDTTDDLEEETEELSGETEGEDSAVHGENSSDCTRYASAAELGELRKFNRSRQWHRRIVLTGGFALFLIIIAGAYVISKMQIENPVTWPGEVSGNFNDGEFRMEIEPNGKCLVYYPITPATVTKSDGNNHEIMTALGKNMDVPFHILFTVSTVPDGFNTTRKESFDNWRKRVSEQEGFAFLDDPQQEFYCPTESGFPYYLMSYTRQDKNFRWQGFASYMRYHDKEMVLLREVPANHFWRAERVLQSFGAFVVSPTMVDYYWEIPEQRMDGDSTRLLQRASYELRKNIAAAVWDDVDLMLRTLLCRAYETDDAVLTAAVVPLWREFREKQKVWYSQCCLAFQTYKNAGNSEGMNRIINECLKRFPSPDDHRHVKIMKNIWTIEE